MWTRTIRTPTPAHSNGTWTRQPCATLVKALQLVFSRSESHSAAMFARRFWSFLIGSALLATGLFLIVAGLSQDGAPEDTLQTGLIGSAIGLIWVAVEYYWPTRPR